MAAGEQASFDERIKRDSSRESSMSVLRRPLLILLLMVAVTPNANATKVLGVDFITLKLGTPNVADVAGLGSELCRRIDLCQTPVPPPRSSNQDSEAYYCTLGSEVKNPNELQARRWEIALFVRCNMWLENWTAWSSIEWNGWWVRSIGDGKAKHDGYGGGYGGYFDCDYRDVAPPNCKGFWEYEQWFSLRLPEGWYFYGIPQGICSYNDPYHRSITCDWRTNYNIEAV